MRNHIGDTGVFDLLGREPCNPRRPLSRCRGVTLIELSFVIGIIAIIVVAALAVYNAVRNSQDLTTAVSDASAIRTAVSNWAGNEPIFATGGPANPTTITGTLLTNGVQIHTLLPGKLREAARVAASDLVLRGVNPWQGDYEIREATSPQTPLFSRSTNGPPNYSDNPFVFLVRITNIPSSQHEPLRRRLEEGSESISQATTASDSGTEILEVVYRI